MYTYDEFTCPANISYLKFAFAQFSFYVLFPWLYIIFFKENIDPSMTLTLWVRSGIFDTFTKIKECYANIHYAILRLFGQYTFSTYTVVRNGREIYTASSMCYLHQSDINSVYRIDRAKYNVCKWIDQQCKQYRLENNDESPELTETHNDIYDFIIHKVDNVPCIRIHRGDFTGKTHTLYTKHYRKFIKSYQVADAATLTVCLPDEASDVDSHDTHQQSETKKSETFTIHLKSPHYFFIEKNELLDKKFLQWKLYNEYGRKDIAEYIGRPFSNYSLVVSYSDIMKDDFENDKEPNPPLYILNDSHSIIIGNQYIVKVDSVLRCPVLDSGEQQVYDIDGILSSYYDCSDSESECENKKKKSSDNDSDSDVTFSSDDDDVDDDVDIDVELVNDKTVQTEKTDVATNELNDPEFEVIECDAQ
jgi:hypothetical protein